MTLLSICINTQNEGPRVKSTVAAFREHLVSVPHEIIVVDDGTTDGCCANLPADTIVIRNETPVGCGRAKRMMAERATGEVLCFLDAHQAPFAGSMESSANRCLRYSTPTVMSPLICRLSYDASDAENWKPCRPGKANLAPNEFGLPPLATEQYRQYLTKNAHDPCRFVGVGVMMRRRDLLAIGNWCNFAGRRGSQERGLALKAFMAGWKFVLDKTLIIGHEFQESKNVSRKACPYSPTSWRDWVQNQWHAWAVVLRQDAFERHIMPELLEHHQTKTCPGYHLQPHVIEERDWFAANAKQRDDQELIDLIAEIRQRKAVSIPTDTGGGQLEPAAVEYLRKHATGRCLEFGTGTGTSTQAILNSNQVSVLVSVDDSPAWTVKASAKVSDHRAMFIVLKRALNGFYDVEPLFQLGMQFDTVLIDGPMGTQARANAFPTILPLLAEGAQVLVDDGHRDKCNIDRWVKQFGLQSELLPSHRGLYRLTKGTT